MSHFLDCFYQLKNRSFPKKVGGYTPKSPHRGLDRCPDKGMNGLQRYAGLAVIAYNLRRVGKILLDQDRKAAERKAVKYRRAA